MFESETVGPCLVQKLKWGGGHAPLGPPVATSLEKHILVIMQYEIKKETRNIKKNKRPDTTKM